MYVYFFIGNPWKMEQQMDMDMKQYCNDKYLFNYVYSKYIEC